MAIILEDFIAGEGIHELRDYFKDRRMSRVEVWSELQAASEYVRKECARELVKRARSGEPEAIRLLVCCPANNCDNLRPFFLPGGVAPPYVGPATLRRRALPERKNDSHLNHSYLRDSTLGESIMMACASESGDYETEAITPWGAFQMLYDSAELAKSQDRSEDQ